MRQRNRRNDANVMKFSRSSRKPLYSDRLYSFIDNILPVRPSFALTISCLAIMFIVFAMACFSAAVFGSSSAKLSAAEEHAGQCSSYYAAETVAADILAAIAADNGASLADENGELKYASNGGDITISHNGGVYSFSVPIVSEPSSDSGSSSAASATESRTAPGGLHVVARITDGSIAVIERYIEQK